MSFGSHSWEMRRWLLCHSGMKGGYGGEGGKRGGSRRSPLGLVTSVSGLEAHRLRPYRLVGPEN